MRLGIRAKLLVFSAVAWAIIFGAYSVYVYRHSMEGTKRMAVSSADLLARQVVASRRLYAATVVSRALEQGMDVTGDYLHRAGSIPLPATFLTETSGTHSAGKGFHANVVSLNPINTTVNPPDPFERQALEKFSVGDRARSYVFEEIGGRRSLRYMIPDVASSQACVDCHNRYRKGTGREYAIGDVMGGVELIIPIGAEMRAAAADARSAIGYGLAAIVLMGLISFEYIRRVVTKPVAGLVNTARELSDGVLTAAPVMAANDEIGELAGFINEVVRRLSTMLEEVQGGLKRAADISATARTMTRDVLDGSRDLDTGLDSIVSAIEEVNFLLSELFSVTGEMAANVEKGKASILDLEAVAGTAVENMDLLVADVDETVRSAGGVSASAKETSENVQELSTTVEQISSFMGRISGRIKDMDENATRGHRFADEVIKDARAGVESVAVTVQGMVQIRDITVESASIINNLCDRNKEIDRILDFIRGVAEETNLLAINAAIIAAQTGSEGKSFSVVANEIKDLAERASTSAQEVSGIIHAVDLESKKACDSMNKGVESVEEGVRLAGDASDALRKIVSSARVSAESVRHIARVSSEQAAESHIVAGLTEKVEGIKIKITQAANVQAGESEGMLKTAGRISELAKRCRGLSGTQTEAERRISATMKEIAGLAERINNILKRQRRNIPKVIEKAGTAGEVSAGNMEKARRTDEMTEELLTLNKRLSESINRFRVR